VEHHGSLDASLSGRLAIDTASFPIRSHIISVNNQVFSDQPPMLAFVLSGPYWILHGMGYRLQEYSVLVPYLLTLLGVTLPAAGAAGLVYRMGRIFELRRELRAGLAAAVVFATGLITYSVVLNAHVPAAVLVLAATGCLIHLAASDTPSRGGAWLVLAGFCAALAATIDLSAIIFVPLLAIVVPALRLRPALRIGGVLLYLLGAAPPVLLHATLVSNLTGDLLPGSFHPELAVRHLHPFPEEAEPPLEAMSQASDNPEPSDLGEDAIRPAPATLWQNAWRGMGRLTVALLGEHGLLVHFPVIVLGFAGMFAVMHRHWPLTTKLLAADSAIAALLALVGVTFSRYGLATAEFGNQWLVLFLPMLFFWAGAWLRRPHHPAIWTTAAVLLIFSILVSLIGATDPMPRGGYDRYTPLAALHNPP
jgi:4-amino-4-deoxy-L-arabinose transferase-like glycosyltransferase